LFVSAGGGNILEYTPGGSQSTFASSYGYPQNAYPEGLAFDNAGNLFVADELEGNILEFTPGGQETTFASGLNGPIGLAFNSAGNLFVSVRGGNILEFTPGGAQSTFASRYGYPEGLAFDTAGNLFVADELEGDIYEYTPGGLETTFASGLNGPIGLAFQDESLTTPEPSALGLMTVGVILLFVRCRCRGTAAMSQ
jgi:sugar lactone lactonase YvrE